LFLLLLKPERVYPNRRGEKGERGVRVRRERRVRERRNQGGFDRIKLHLFHFLSSFQPNKVNYSFYKDLDFTKRVYPSFLKFFSCLSSSTTASIKPFLATK
jgi:hypothetical protein